MRGVLEDVEARLQPFPCLVATAALPVSALDSLTDAFQQDLPWVRHDSFYHCFLAELTDRVSPEVRRAVARRLASLTELPLVDDCTVTAQRMEPGDHALPHTDRPLLGYEAVRLVVQLDGQGDASVGGVFAVHPDPDGVHTSWTRAPRRGDAVGFVMRASSHHSVLPTTRVRRTVVFHVRHRGNEAVVAEAVHGWFDGMRFDRLPPSLDAVMADAEARWPDDLTHRAGCVAWLLSRWGCDDATVRCGYEEALGYAPSEDAAVSLARWATFLWTDHFDVDRWAALAAHGAPSTSAGVMDAWQVLVGRGLGRSEAVAPAAEVGGGRRR